MNDADRLAARAVSRARRLAELEAVLQDCMTLLDSAHHRREEAAQIEARIERVRREIERLRGLTRAEPAPADEQRAITAQLAHWVGNLAPVPGQDQ